MVLLNGDQFSKAANAILDRTAAVTDLRVRQRKMDEAGKETVQGHLICHEFAVGASWRGEET
jgi:hypothetical protein